MKKEGDSQREQPGGASGQGGAAGGFDIGSILSGLGGMAGAAGAGGPGGAGGFDIGSILSGLGGMGGASSGNPGAGAPGVGGMGDMLGKIMNDPKAMAAFQKAQQNPRVSDARECRALNPCRTCALGCSWRPRQLVAKDEGGKEWDL